MQTPIAQNDPDPTPPSNADEPFDIETLDQLRSLDSDGTFIAELVGMFREDIAAHVEKLHDAISAHDQATIKATAHQAKGASANLGMRALAGSLRGLEVAADGPAGGLTDAMSAVEAKVAEALRFVETLAPSGASA